MSALTQTTIPRLHFIDLCIQQMPTGLYIGKLLQALQLTRPH